MALTRRGGMKVALGALGLALVLALGTAAWWQIQVVHVSTLHTFDVQDKRQLVGFASNVFVGRITQRVGTAGAPTSKPGYTSPQTQFAVEVLENIKGSLTGTVTVNQDGGERDGVPVLMDGDPLLVPGQTYLFVTRLNPQQGWYTVTTPALADIRLADAAQMATVVAEFREAHRQQIVRP